MGGENLPSRHLLVPKTSIFWYPLGHSNLLWIIHLVRTCAYQRERIVSFLENCVYVLNQWSHNGTSWYNNDILGLTVLKHKWETYYEKIRLRYWEWNISIKKKSIPKSFNHTINCHYGFLEFKSFNVLIVRYVGRCFLSSLRLQKKPTRTYILGI